ncbi:hypothetical protein [Legionella oakridgensis]|uniref:Uncharacterized protein n=2 Tax=Legionella oakridgensis TaxID=29423 RepID=W0BHH9_9GAMM|nr:hypothetical protein [Legionella oakridgensis]AHE67859.1 hypothetical protein Loa_02317 [Legionella oakridgensis ATCC 33761 = DSM 21215]KTD38686.1 hypothetical protein Loak_1174 [Legionella oakridgensis]STY20870.1 Uncharacterised protein [Legionella longbeachae]
MLGDPAIEFTMRALSAKEKGKNHKVVALSLPFDEEQLAQHWLTLQNAGQLKFNVIGMVR